MRCMPLEARTFSTQYAKNQGYGLSLDVSVLRRSRFSGLIQQPPQQSSFSPNSKGIQHCTGGNYNTILRKMHLNPYGTGTTDTQPHHGLWPLSTPTPRSEYLPMPKRSWYQSQTVHTSHFVNDNKTLPKLVL